MAFAISPTSTVQLLQNIPFDVNYENTMYFSSRQEQENYFANKVAVTLNNYSYQRTERGSIKIGSPNNPEGSFSPVSDWPLIKSTYGLSYMRFKNDNFENKWFYAFVDRVDYINNATVEVFYHIDVIQTWLLDCTFNDCMIEREHTVTDNFGEHTLPEGLETGPYRSIPAAVYLQDPNSPSGESYMFNRFEYQRCIILATTLDIGEMIKGNTEYSYGVIVPGAAGVGGGGEYYSGVRYSAFRINGESVQGIYRITFSGTYVAGDKILVDDVMTTLTAAQVTNPATVAAAVAQNITANSEHFYATHSQAAFAFIDVVERPGWQGYGYPNVQSNSVRGAFYVEVITPGSDGTMSEIHKLNDFLQRVASSNLESAVVGLFMMPYEFYPKTDAELTNGVSPLNMRVAFPTSLGNPLGGYVPRNKKLFCSPYNEMYVTNNTGNEAQYRFEDFSNPNVRNSCMFSIWGNLSMNPGMYCAPMFYNGNGYMAGAVDDELVVTGFPMCSYAIDSFKAWLSQNAGMIGATAGSLVAGWATQIGKAYATSATGLMNAGIMSATPGPNVAGVNPAGYIGQHAMYSPKEGANLNAYLSGSQQSFTGLIGGTLAALGSLYDHSRRPPQSHGQSNGNLSYQAGQLTFSWYYKQIKPEYAEIIDNFFDMYGYTTHRLGTPIINARPCYTYTKTIGCSIKADLPAEVSRAIESIFDKGIRFWKTSATFGNFNPNVNNNIPT